MSLRGSLTFCDEHFHQLDHVPMPQALEEFDLAHGSHGEAVPLGFHPDPLERDQAAGFDVASLVDFAIRAFADLDEPLVQLGRRRCRRRRDWSRRCCGRNGGGLARDFFGGRSSSQGRWV